MLLPCSRPMLPIPARWRHRLVLQQEGFFLLWAGGAGANHDPGSQASSRSRPLPECGRKSAFGVRGGAWGFAKRTDMRTFVRTPAGSSPWEERDCPDHGSHRGRAVRTMIRAAGPAASPGACRSADFSLLRNGRMPARIPQRRLKSALRQALHRWSNKIARPLNPTPDGVWWRK